jgi:hypothetical protein
MKNINLSWIDNRDVHYPTDEPNQTHDENLSQGKPCPDFSKAARRFGVNYLSLGMPHRMTYV